MKTTFLKSMFKAGRLARKGSLFKATGVLRRAWSGLAPAPRAAPRKARKPKTLRPVNPIASAAREASTRSHARQRPQAVPPVVARRPTPSTVDGFRGRVFDQAGMHGRYKVFVPPSRAAASMPLVVMLHGCTQTPDDFAAGTEMNLRAMEQGFVVLYPAQSRRANHSACWNWYRRQDQARGSGEPALIAGMTLAVIDELGLDRRSVSIAGLSAGGAMAAIVAREYPEIFSAVGIHSGMPAGAATNLVDALSLMRTGVGRRRTLPTGEAPATAFVPTIVFHGDEDRTVHPANGLRAVEQAVQRSGRDILRPTVVGGQSKSGKIFSRSTYVSPAGQAVIEHWIVSGGSHAWSGGSARGTYTDPNGPSATDAMLRFFEQARAAG